MDRQEILAEISIERDAQNAKWGGQQHDQEHMPNDWITYIAKHAGMAADGDNFREQMIKVAALAVAAIESLNGNSTSSRIDKIMAEFPPEMRTLETRKLLEPYNYQGKERI